MPWRFAVRASRGGGAAGVGRDGRILEDWAASIRCSARHGIDLLLPVFVVCCGSSPNVVDPAVMEQAEAAAGSSHKGRFHARLCIERKKAGCLSSACHSQVPRR